MFTNYDILDKRPQVTNWTSLDLHACLKLTEKLKSKDAKWNVNEFTTTPSLDWCNGPGVIMKRFVISFMWLYFIIVVTIVFRYSFIVWLKCSISRNFCQFSIVLITHAERLQGLVPFYGKRA